MSPLTLWPIVGTAACAVGRGMAQSLSETLSFAANLGIAPAESKEVSLENSPLQSQADHQQAFESKLERFRDLLLQRLSAAGVNLNQPLELQSDGLGGVQVAEDHPDRAFIEQTISGDARLQQEFQSLADEHAKRSPDLDPHDFDFGLLLSGDGVQVSLANR